MIPIGSSSSRTNGRLVISNPSHVVGRHDAQVNTMPVDVSSNLASCNVLTGRGGTAWSLRHVQRRVQLTLGLRCRETGARLPPAAAHDLPTPVLGMQRFRGKASAGFTATKPERQ